MSAIKTKRFGVSYRAGEGQGVDVFINDRELVYNYTSGLGFDEALELCMRLEKSEAIGRDQKYQINEKTTEFLYIGTVGTIERWHDGRALFVSETGAKETLPIYALDKIEGEHRAGS